LTIKRNTIVTVHTGGHSPFPYPGKLPGPEKKDRVPGKRSFENARSNAKTGYYSDDKSRENIGNSRVENHFLPRVNEQHVDNARPVADFQNITLGDRVKKTTIILTFSALEYGNTLTACPTTIKTINDDKSRNVRRSHARLLFSLARETIR